MTESPRPATTASARFHCIDVRAPDAPAAERVLAEALAEGAVGAEQRDEEGGVTLLLYARASEAEAVRRAAAGVLGAAAVGAAVAVAATDWSEAWKAASRPVEVSPRLRVRASFERSPPRPGQRDLVIDPGQAFGTGGHESTRLALAWIDRLRGELAADTRVLDVGTGSGVLALAALALGAGTALGFDLDPLAAPAARDNARDNGFAGRFAAFSGPIGALAPGCRFDGILANLLRRELEPLLGSLVSHIQTSGWIVISGLLAGELDDWRRRSDRAGLHAAGTLRETDASGAVWASLLMRPRAPRAGR